MRSIDAIIGVGWSFPIDIDERGGLRRVRGDDKIAEAIFQILSTPVGQRVMRPEFGSRLHELVFAPMNAGTFSDARHYAEEALGYWEPRIDVEDILVQPAPGAAHQLLITIHYRIKATHDERSLVYPFYTIPPET
jgi:phage baseplate assembly protein W